MSVHTRMWVLVMVLSLTLPLPGCLGLGFLFSGARGGSAGTPDQTSRTFTAPMEEVQHNTLETLQRMGFPIESTEHSARGVRLLATSASRVHPLAIEIDLEPLSPQTTRMQVVAKQGFFRNDAATATEIIQQTAKTLERPAQAPVTLRE